MSWLIPSRGWPASLTHADALVFDMPDTGSLRGDLVALTERIAALLAARHTKAIVAAVFGAAHQKPALLALLHGFTADRLAREQVIFQRAVQRGELPSTADPKAIMDLIVGAIWARLLLRGETFAHSQLVTIVETILHGILG